MLDIGVRIQELQARTAQELQAVSAVSTVSLFSGCGGLDLGATAAGANVIFAVDAMEAAFKTLKRHLPTADTQCQRVELIKSFPQADLLIGGYPCQSFSMGGRRAPVTDGRSDLYKQFSRALGEVEPLYFVAENVIGLLAVAGGAYFHRQIESFSLAGKHGYNISWKVLNAADYGVPQRRKRLFIVGVRKDLGLFYQFPPPTHGAEPGLTPHASHGDAIAHLPLWPTGEFYERPGGEDDTFPWYYMSRNRKAAWDKPSYTVVANWRHVTIHPASPIMKMKWSNLSDGWKQRWDFSDEYEHLSSGKLRPILEQPRRLSWRECAKIQTFPDGFEPDGNVQSKFTQIGNAVPPRLSEAVIHHLISGKGLSGGDRLVEVRRGRLERGGLR